jgi:hypothetical protein
MKNSAQAYVSMLAGLHFVKCGGYKREDGSNLLIFKHKRTSFA